MTHLNKIYHITGSASQYLQAVMILHQVSQSSSLSEMDHYLMHDPEKSLRLFMMVSML